MPARSDDEPGHWDGSLLELRTLFQSDNRIGWENACRRAAFNARLSGNDVLCRVLGRYTFVVDGSDVGLAPHLIADGFWEIWVTSFIARQLRSGMVCLDAGANIGYYTALLADLVGPEGRVIAAEPLPGNRRLLARNLHHNGFAPRVQLIDAALGEADGRAALLVPPGEPKNAFIGMVDESRIASGEFESCPINVTSIDALGIPRLDFVKIDVEASEEAVWAGMQETLERSPDIKIVMEVNCLRYSDAAGFINRIKDRFPLRAIDGGGNARVVTLDELLASSSDVMLALFNS